jgi:hypothetical protein
MNTPTASNWGTTEGLAVSSAIGPRAPRSPGGSAVYGRVRMLKALYWLAVVAVSVALVIVLVLIFESLDDSSLEGAGPLPGLTAAA